MTITASRGMGFAGVQLPFTFARHHSHMHLLVVDDDTAVREALAVVLGLDGFEVTTASDGREGMKAVRDVRPHPPILPLLIPRLHPPNVRPLYRSPLPPTP